MGLWDVIRSISAFMILMVYLGWHGQNWLPRKDLHLLSVSELLVAFKNEFRSSWMPTEYRVGLFFKQVFQMIIFFNPHK